MAAEGYTVGETEKRASEEYANFTAKPVETTQTQINVIKEAPAPDAISIPAIVYGGASATEAGENINATQPVIVDESAPPVVPTETHIHDANAAAEQGGNEPEVHDVGWNKRLEGIPSPLVSGVANEDFWLLIRRFNMQMYHVRSVDPPLGGRLDLTTSKEEEFSPDKLRANMERLYMSVVISGIALVKHVARIRSWHERKRTTIACAAYFTIWILNLVMPAMLTLLLVLIVVPRSRRVLFPKVPLAVVNAKTGALQTPPSGHLGSYDSLTGAPEDHKGQAVEQEAANFVTGFASVAVGAAMGKGPQEPGQPKDSESNEAKAELGSSMPDPTTAIEGGQKAREKTKGQGGKDDKAKEPMQQKIWEKARPFMRSIAEVSDTWERLANVLSPTAPFPSDMARLKLAGPIIAPLLLSLVVPAAWIFRGTTLILGLVFFSDPLIQRGAHWINTNYPDWADALKLENSILKGVPTNAQLTVTLLRLGEIHKTPLPPPPTAHPKAKAPEEPRGRQIVAELPVDATPEEIAANSLPPSENATEKSPESKNKRSKLLGFMKGAAKASVATLVGVDRIKAQAGSEHSIDRLGVIHGQRSKKPADGPSHFVSRFEGKKGVVTISTTATSPCVSFERSNSANDAVAPVWSVALNEISGLKKVGGVGFKGRLLIGMALGMEIVDGMIIEDKEGRKYHLTALPRRDELFNRLIAIGGQSWECL